MKDYSTYLKELFPASHKVQKLSVNLGFGCPNRDGTIGVGGCIYCNNEAFSPAYCHQGANVAQQIEAGKSFFSKKYKDMDYLVYFQNYTGSYSLLEELERIYHEALSVEGVVGLVIGTRPDCVADEFLDMVASLPTTVMMEYGAETSHDATLRLINRGHTWECTVDAVSRTMKRHLHCGLHLINGLPGESEDDMLATVQRACALNVDSLKFHHLQILKGTRLAATYKELPKMATFTPESYIALCRKIMSIVPEHISIERFLAQSPPQMVIHPKWGLKNYQFMQQLKKL